MVFWRNDLIKIPLPNVLQDVQSVLRPIGADKLLADLHQQLNRGAEQAAPVAKDIFCRRDNLAVNFRRHRHRQRRGQCRDDLSTG